ncbi:MAG TPA: hypothetical protein VID29_00485 [Solirubrobacteraceae bacterium]
MLRRIVLFAVCLAVSVVVGSASVFAADTHVFASSFGSAGSGAGQVSLGEGSGVAVSAATHDVYVADTGNVRVDQFTAGGVFVRAWGWGVADGLPAFETCTLSCQRGLEGSGEGQFTTPVFVAVDNSGGVSAGDVYVGDRGTNTVLKFTGEGAYLATNSGAGATSPVAGPFGALAGVTVDGSGSVWVYDANGNMFEFAQDGSFTSDWNSGRGVTPRGIDADSAGNLYVLTGGGSVEQFSATGTDVGPVNGDASNPTGFAFDRSSDELYMDSGGSLIRHYGASCDAGGSCAALDVFGEGQLNGAAGLAVDPSTHAVFAADAGNARVVVFSPVTLPDVSTGEASAVAPSSATLQGTVNPNGTAITDCHFDYVDEAGFKPGEANPYAGGASAPCAGTPAGSTPQPVSASVAGLTPGTVYHFRLGAANSGGAVAGLDQTFSTGPTIDATYATDVTGTSAAFHAQINPRGLATTYHFDYGATTGYGHSTAESASIGADSEDHTVTVHVQGLEAGTVYHFRVVATNAITSSGLDGPDRAVTTQAVSPGGFTLPDNRGYELVTPAVKGDGTLPVVQLRYGTIGGFQAAAGGDGMAYSSELPFPGATAGGVVNYVASRGGGGWSSHVLTPPQASVTGDVGSPMVAGFSNDLRIAAFEDGGGYPRDQDSPPLVAGEPQNNQNLFVRDNTTNTYQLTDITPSGVTPQATNYEGASPDLSHVLFNSSAHLVAGAVDRGNLYEWVGGIVRLAGLIPPGSATRCGVGGPECVVAPEGAGLGGGSNADEPGGALGAVSPDGANVFFTNVDSSTQSAGQLYVRENGTATVEYSASQKNNGAGPGGTDPAGPHLPSYWTTSGDGSKVFFTSCEKLTNDATANATQSNARCVTGSSFAGNDLYVYDTAVGALTDLTVDHSGDPLGADVQSVLGASTDGSYVYFVANGVLASGASPGDCRAGPENAGRQCNLYFNHGGTTTFVARIDDISTEGHSFNAWRTYAGLARVTADGTHLAFQTTASLTGYDNTLGGGASSCGGDAVQAAIPVGSHCQEVYIYDSLSQELSCASCNPSGARPQGASGLTGIELRSVGASSQANYEYLPRTLSEDGSRLFFESEDALVPGDVNGKMDVYEYEGGRVYLISSGTSAGESRFLDASASGNDVFFVTGSRLVGQDTDGKLDIYDARVGGGFPFTPPRPGCSGEACRQLPAPGATGIALGSSGAAGAGNIIPVQSSQGQGTPGGRRQPLTRTQRLAAALKACQRKPRRRRASCRARAHRLYGSAGAGRSIKQARGGK